MCAYGYVHVRVCMGAWVCVRAHVCVWVGVRARVHACCACVHVSTSMHTLQIFIQIHSIPYSGLFLRGKFSRISQTEYNL